MKKTLLLLVAVLLCGVTFAAAPRYELLSPDGRLKTTVTASETLTYDLCLGSRTLLQPSALALELSDGTTWGKALRRPRVVRNSVNTSVPSPLYRSDSEKECYNAMTLTFGRDWSVEFRLYNDGIAYRFISHRNSAFQVKDEQVEYRFAEDYAVTTPYVRGGKAITEQYGNSFENAYTKTTLSQMLPERLSFLPVAVDAGGVKLCITESNLNAYPGLYLLGGRRDGDSYCMVGHFAPYPKEVKQGGHNNLEMQVQSREDYLAPVEAPRAFPWRAMIVAERDADLAASSLTWLLADPSRLDDTSWIKPGKVAWDWWNDWNIEGVDFRAGINTETYKYYIDFAAANGIEYVILDEGWAVNKQADLMQVVPEIDLPGIVNYGAAKGVGIILWAGFQAFNRDMEGVCAHYAKMGVKGFKVDFMNRDDAQMTAFNYKAAECAARHKLILDLHGTHKPAGLNRTWPNMINFEGVNGLEQLKWTDSSLDQVEYDTQLPFLRQAAGPMDYTQGAMVNYVRHNFRDCYTQPGSQGTRCHQLALYMVFDSPLNMLCDAPSNYMREPECTRFIAGVPTVWDETRILAAEMGQYIVMARRKGSTWYVGGITNWTPRDMEVDLSSLVEGASKVELYRDGVNADRRATDYRRVELPAAEAATLKVHMAPGGGFAVKISGK